jgi:hypothetical protein
MRVFFLINKYITQKSLGNINSFIKKRIALKKKKLKKLALNNLNKFLILNVNKGSVPYLSVDYAFSINKKKYSYKLKIKKYSKLKFLNFNLKRFNFRNLKVLNNSKKFNYTKVSFFSSLIKNRVMRKQKFYREINNIRGLHNSNVFFSNVIFNENLLSKSNFYFLNKFSYSFQKNEINSLVSFNSFGDFNYDLFLKNSFFYGISNFVSYHVNNSSSFSSLGEINFRSFFFRNIFLQRIAFENSQLVAFFSQFYISFNSFFFKKFNNLFKYKEKISFFLNDNDYIYKFFKRRVSKLYVTYYNKLNYFFYNLKKKDILFRKASRGLFLKKYNFVKSYLNDFINLRLNKKLFIGFLPRVKSVNRVFNPQGFNANFLLNNFKGSYILNFKNHNAYSFFLFILKFKNFLKFFSSSFKYIKTKFFINYLYSEITSIYSYFSNFFLNQYLNFSLLNLNFISFSGNFFKRFNKNKSFYYKSFSYFFKKYIPFYFDFLFINNFIINIKNKFSYFNALISFKKSLNLFFFNQNYLKTIHSFLVDYTFSSYKSLNINFISFIFFYNFFTALDYLNNNKLNIVSFKHFFSFFWFSFIYK